MSAGCVVEARETAAGAVAVVGLEARGSALVGVLNTAAAGLVAVIGEALERRVWVGAGITSPQQWAGLRFGLSPQRAHRLVVVAEALRGLPLVAAAFAAGEIGEDHVAAIAA